MGGKCFGFFLTLTLNVAWISHFILDDTKMNCVIDVVKECHPDGSRDLVRWLHVNTMKFNKAMCKVLHMSQGKPKHEYRLGNEWVNREEPCGEAPGSSGGKKGGH